MTTLTPKNAYPFAFPEFLARIGSFHEPPVERQTRVSPFRRLMVSLRSVSGSALHPRIYGGVKFGPRSGRNIDSLSRWNWVDRSIVSKTHEPMKNSGTRVPSDFLTSAFDVSPIKGSLKNYSPSGGEQTVSRNDALPQLTVFYFFSVDIFYPSYKFSSRWLRDKLKINRPELFPYRSHSKSFGVDT